MHIMYIWMVLHEYEWRQYDFFKQRSFAGPQLLNYLVIYIYEYYDFLIKLMPPIQIIVHGQRVERGHSCLPTTNSLKISLAHRSKKISRYQITKIYSEPNDELGMKLNRMTCSIWKLLIFIIVLTERYVRHRRRHFYPVGVYVRVWSIML